MCIDRLSLAYDLLSIHATTYLIIQVVSIAVPLVGSTLVSRNIQHDVKNWYVRAYLERAWALCSEHHSAAVASESGVWTFTLSLYRLWLLLCCRYQYLRQPSWKPPRWAFGVVWPILYIMMGTASWLVWHNGGWQHHSSALTMYAIQLALNLSWPPLFFSGHKLGLALADSTGEHTQASFSKSCYLFACMGFTQLIKG